jgi:hypothetical protein
LPGARIFNVSFIAIKEAWGYTGSIARCVWN